jgi:integrase
MASIEKRTRDGQVRWYARYRDPAGKQRVKVFGRKVDAERFLTTVEASKLVGSYVDPGRARITVGEVAGRWIAGKANLKPTTRARYESALSVHVLPRWQSVPLDRIEHSDVQSWVVDLAASGQSGASVRKSFGVLSAVLGLAVRDKRLPANPATGVDLPSLNERRRKYLSGGQVEQLAESAGGDGWLVVLVLAYCGLRWSELAALRVGRIDLMRRRLAVAEAMTEVNGGRLVWGTPKSHESRSVPVPRFLVDALTVHLAGKAAEDLVFTTAAGAPLRNRNARRAWFDQAAESIGERGLTPHELRHTAASLAVSAGANVKAVQRMLGHASAAMTLDRYADLFDDDLDAVADRLDAARTAGVYPLCTGADVVTLAGRSKMAVGQELRSL